MSNNVKPVDNLVEAVKYLSKLDQYQFILSFIEDCRETKFQALEQGLDSGERADAKIIGGMIEDDYLLKILTPQKDG
tara:strand:+ start:5391 stop:5621 length:231 start_codon:yes stop_codon:yes gene_type:complete